MTEGGREGPRAPKAQGLGEVAKAWSVHRPNPDVHRVIHAQKCPKRSLASPAQALKHHRTPWVRRGPGPTYLERVSKEHNEVLQVQHQAGVGAVGLEGRAEMETRL